MKTKTRMLTYGAMIAAMYAALTLAASFTPLGAFQFGPIQVRLAEALCVLPALTPAAIPGLFIGCMIANIMGAGIWDVVIGSLATLLASWLSYKLRNYPILVPLPPVILNAVSVGSMLYFLGYSDYGLFLTMLSVGVGEAVACYGLGLPLLLYLRKHNLFR